ncbi:MAG TPA: hypothetical protein VNT32_04655 [Thermoleophilaceae bacterium]|nr:hypothetical protein [Thermoleophilaceae bacterium]
MALPPLLDTRSPGQQVLLANVVPAVFGAVAGVMAGVSEPAYLVLAILGIAGGYFAGLEHRNGGEGAVRGIVGGFLFGLFIIAAHEISGQEEKAELPPALLLVLLTTSIGAGLGALGGRSRARRMRNAA